MASRYAVGLPFTWDATAGTKWATTSGGAGGAAIPTSSDDVFVDGNSGSGTLTVSNGTTRNCKTFTTTGFSHAVDITNSGLNVSGSITIGSGTTFTGSGSMIMAATGTLTTNGVTLPNFSTTGGTVTLGDNLTLTTDLSVGAGALDTNGKTVNCRSLLDASGVTITLGASSIVLTDSGTGSTCDMSHSTVNAGTSTIKMVGGGSGAGPSNFVGGSKTYNNVWFHGGSTSDFWISGSNTFADLKADVGDDILEFAPSTTQTVSTLTMGGTAGHEIQLISNNPGTPFTISKSSGSVTVDYCFIQDSTATGGATFTATHSTNGGNNLGWHGVGFDRGVSVRHAIPFA